jgi:hypothetical protein
MGAGLLVEHGIWTDAEAKTYVGAAALALAALLWSLYQKYWHRLKLVTAMGLPAGTSEQHVEAVIDSPLVSKPPTTITKDEVVRPLQMKSGEPIPPSLPPAA